MEVTITPRKLTGRIDDIISSKSLAHRALICAALCERPTVIYCNSASQDITATVGVLSAIGAKVEHQNGAYTVTPIDALPQNRVTLDFGESGSTLRFMLPILGELGIKAEIITHGRLTSRPLSPLYEQLIAHGMTLSPQGQCPMYCEGKLSGQHYEIDGQVSSQFVSGLLFALACSTGGSVQVTGKLESASYVALTVGMLEKFGVTIERDGNLFNVHTTKLRSPGNVQVEGDWSNAAFWLTAGAFTSDGITVCPLDANSLQGDRAITNILEKFGANVKFESGGVKVSGNGLTGAEIDAADIPDLVPAVAVAAACASGVTVIHNIARLRYKESDRVASICEMLAALGAKAQADQNTLTIYGGKLIGGTVNSYNDHRIAMAAATASCMCSEQVKILGAEAVNKSYPNFFECLIALGGQLQKKEQ